MPGVRPHHRAGAEVLLGVRRDARFRSDRDPRGDADLQRWGARPIGPVPATGVRRAEESVRPVRRSRRLHIADGDVGSLGRARPAEQLLRRGAGDRRPVRRDDREVHRGRGDGGLGDPGGTRGRRRADRASGFEIVDAVAALGGRVRAPDLRARAGIVTGHAALLGNPDEGLVVGDRVNTAARIQATADPGTVLVDDVTRQVTSAAIAYEDAGRHELKGKSEPRAAVASGRGAERHRRCRPRRPPGAVRRSRCRAAPDQGAVPRRSEPFLGSARRGLGRRRRRQDPAALGVPRLPDEPPGPVPVAPGPLSALRRRRRVLGARGDGPASARDPGGRSRRGGRAKAPRRTASAGSSTRASASSCRPGSGSCSASSRPASDARSCSRAGGCSSSAWPSSIRW